MMTMMLKVVTWSWLHTIEKLEELFWYLLRTKFMFLLHFPLFSINSRHSITPPLRSQVILKCSQILAWASLFSQTAFEEGTCRTTRPGLWQRHHLQICSLTRRSAAEIKNRKHESGGFILNGEKGNFPSGKWLPVCLVKSRSQGRRWDKRRWPPPTQGDFLKKFSWWAESNASLVLAGLWLRPISFPGEFYNQVFFIFRLGRQLCWQILFLRQYFSDSRITRVRSEPGWPWGPPHLEMLLSAPSLPTGKDKSQLLSS